MPAPVMKPGTRLHRDAPEWVRTLYGLAKYAGHAAGSVAVLLAIVAVVATALQTAAEEIRDRFAPLDDDGSPSKPDAVNATQETTP